MFVKSLSATALKCSSLLTNFSFHATQKTKRQKKRFCANFTKPFCLLFFVDPFAPLRQGWFYGVWGKSKFPTCHPETGQLDGQSKDLGSFSSCEKEQSKSNKYFLKYQSIIPILIIVFSNRNLRKTKLFVK